MGSSFRRSKRSTSSRGLGRLEVGEEYTVRVFAVSRRGDGMAKIRGYTVFIPNTKAGDVVRVRITRVWSRFATAEVIGE
ncbi:MAG: deoxyribonuclease [Thermoprotei archaeon]|nr:MAG: deoxyribonuclease [Thermoprotei archaeon]